MTEVANDGYRIGRQRIVQADKHDHARREGDERSRCEKYGVKALFRHEQAFVPYARTPGTGHSLTDSNN